MQQGVAGRAGGGQPAGGPSACGRSGGTSRQLGACAVPGLLQGLLVSVPATLC